MTIKNLLDKARGFRALVVGDAIIDEYVYVRPLGKSPKEHIVTYARVGTERFQGGVFAAAKHVESICEAVVQHGDTYTIKSRRVVQESMRKVHEEHDVEDRGSSDIVWWPGGCDLTIVTDFGHGYLTPGLIASLTEHSKFLAVNAQTNSANHGFNLITKYPRADYAVVDELEARLAAHDRDAPLEHVIERLGFQRMIVTLGHRGCIGYDHGEFTRAEAVSGQVVDTMGAGDAFFCVTAPLAAAGADMRTLCEVGNAAGAIKCGVVGHRQAVTRQALLDLLEGHDLLQPQRAEDGGRQRLGPV